MDLTCCEACPHRCRVDRNRTLGFCRAGSSLRVARAALHFGEEPCISGTRGSGTIFFSHCNLACRFCQNHEISAGGFGKDLSREDFLATLFRLQEEGAHNLNLVSPTQYWPQLIPLLREAKRKLSIPIVYNGNGFERLEVIQALEGLIDVYLPDLKYSDDSLAFRYSGIEDYFLHASRAIRAMVDQVGTPLEAEGIMTRGVLVRHLVLPGALSNTRGVLAWISENLPGIPVSLMSQYTPLFGASECPPLDRSLSPAEYEEALAWFEAGELEGFVQELDAAGTEQIPDFDLSGVFSN